jgi:hypothetical protein
MQAGTTQHDRRYLLEHLSSGGKFTIPVKRILAAGLLMLGGLALPAVDVSAQNIPPSDLSPSQLVNRPDEKRTPAEIAAENYAAPGVRVGSFMLFPILEADQSFNDNIYATSAATGRTGSFIEVIKPSMELKSNWSTHMLNFFARGGIGLYSADAGQNFQDVTIGTDGRFDIQRDWNIVGGASFNRSHEELGTPNTVTGTFQPTFFNQLSGNLGYRQRFGQLKAQLDGQVDNFNYLNNPTGPAQGTIFNTDRDRTELRESARFGYEFIPGFEVWTRGSLNQRRYVNDVDTLGFARNSSGWDWVGGVAIDFGGITSLEAFAGYLQQNYVDARFQTVQTPAFGLTGYWNPSRPLWIKPFIRRTVDDTALDTDSGYLKTAAGLDVTYDLRPNIHLTGHGDYTIADYQAIEGTSSNRYDQYYTARVEVLYLPTPHFFVGPSYQFVHRTSNQFNSDYDQNLIMLRLGARL